MDKERKILFERGPDRAIALMKKVLMTTYSLTEEMLDKLDPYEWGSHDLRYRLWVVRRYIELVKPEDATEKEHLLISDYNFQNQVALAFRHLGKDDVDSFKENMQNLGFKIGQMPSRKGPWSPINNSIVNK